MRGVAEVAAMAGVFGAPGMCGVCGAAGVAGVAGVAMTRGRSGLRRVHAFVALPPWRKNSPICSSTCYGVRGWQGARLHLVHLRWSFFHLRHQVSCLASAGTGDAVATVGAVRGAQGALTCLGAGARGLLGAL